MVDKGYGMRLIGAALVTLLLAGCTSMSESWGVGFMQGVRAVPKHDFTSGEKKQAIEAKVRFEKPFNAELKKKLAENELSGLKGWLIFFDFFSDGTTKTANVWIYTYWGKEQRYNVYSVPLESFLDKAQLPAIVEDSTQEVTSFLLRKAASRYRQTVD